MNNLAFIVHDVATVGLLLALLGLVTGLLSLSRSPNGPTLQGWLRRTKLAQVGLSLSGLALGVSGVPLMLEWGYESAWLNLSVVTTLGLSVLVPLVLAPRLRVLSEIATDPEADFESHCARLERGLWLVTLTVVALALGTWALMLAKPALLPSLVVLGSSLLVAWGLSVWLAPRQRLERR